MALRYSVERVRARLLRRQDFCFFVLSVAKKRLNTENTETLSVLSGEALKALSTQRSWLCLRLCGTAKLVQTITLRPAIIELRISSLNSDS